MRRVNPIQHAMMRRTIGTFLFVLAVVLLTHELVAAIVLTAAILGAEMRVGASVPQQAVAETFVPEEVE